MYNSYTISKTSSVSPAIIFQIILTAIASLILSSCARNPVTGRSDFVTMSEAQEINLGKQSDPSIVAQFGIYDDKAIQSFISQKGQQMAKISHRPNLPFTFRVVDSPVINAFALPGGYVYFTRGILAHFNNEAEFAGVLGHEIGHVTARHGVKAQSRQMLGQIGLIGGAILAPRVMQQMGGQIQQALGLAFLKHGRDDESQSDRLGVEYSTKINYDSKYMAGFFKTLHRISAKNGQRIPTMQSTHPDPLDRFQKVASLTKEWQSKTPGNSYKVNRNQYLQMIDGLVYGENPRNGFTKNNYFYHPDLKFQFKYPASWKVANQPSQVLIVDAKQTTGVIFSLAGNKGLQEAAQGFVQQSKMTVQSSNKTTVNGMAAVKITGAINSKNQQGQVVSQPLYVYMIQKTGVVYQFIGLGNASTFNANISNFDLIMKSFNNLTNQSILNVKPEKIDIKTVSTSAPLKVQLRKYGIPANRLEEFAILNGMDQNDNVQKGTMIKVLEK